MYDLCTAVKVGQKQSVVKDTLLYWKLQISVRDVQVQSLEIQEGDRIRVLVCVC